MTYGACHHALAALDALPQDPTEMDRDNLEVLLAGVRGQQRLVGGFRDDLLTALAQGDLLALRRVLDQSGDIDAALALLRPHRRAADRMYTTRYSALRAATQKEKK